MLLNLEMRVRSGPMKQYREREGLSQSGAAEAAGVSLGTWGTIECLQFGRISKVGEALSKIAACIGCGVDELMPEDAEGGNYPNTRIRYIDASLKAIAYDEQYQQRQIEADPRIAVDAALDGEHDLTRGKVEKALNTLTYREREIMKLRYGIGEHDGVRYTLEEIGKIFKVTRERVRIVEAKAILKLRHPTRVRLFYENK